jgi:peptide/nickel transport system ATP-binding protein
MGNEPMTQKSDVLIDVKNLKVHFAMREGTVKAVDDVSFSIPRSKTLGVVGESGCGKSVTSRAVLRIVPHPGKIIAGQILFNRNGGGHPIDLVQMNARGREIRKIRGGEIAMVFQEPMTSLSPVHTVANQIMEAILLHQNVSKREAREQAIDMLRLVNMPKPEQTIDSYPHQLSGGMRQRVMIAMALSCKPGLLIADEPTTALDVTTEAQILDLMRELQDRLGMAIMYITHNLGVVAEMAEEVIVMYLGKIVERADVDTIYHNPQHPYTRNLLLSIPRLGQKTGRRLQAIKGMVPDPFNLPQGCSFHTRCPDFMPGVCDAALPPEVEISTEHRVLCHLHT